MPEPGNFPIGYLGRKIITAIAETALGNSGKREVADLIVADFSSAARSLKAVRRTGTAGGRLADSATNTAGRCAVSPHVGTTTEGEFVMNIDKDQIVQFLKDKGQDQRADEAARELPDHVDSEEHFDLLTSHGIDLDELKEKFGGGLGNYL